MKLPRRLLVSLFLFALYACGEPNKSPRNIVDPRARALADSAMLIDFPQRKYTKALSLLNQAVCIDSNFAIAFFDKLSIFSLLKQYDSALVSANACLKISPDNPDLYLTIGSLYHRTGDSQSSKKFYEQAASKYGDILDTMSKKNRSYNPALMNKGLCLVFIGRQREGNELLKEACDNEPQELIKNLYCSLINKSKDQILQALEESDSTNGENDADGRGRQAYIKGLLNRKFTTKGHNFYMLTKGSDSTFNIHWGNDKIKRMYSEPQNLMIIDRLEVQWENKDYLILNYFIGSNVWINLVFPLNNKEKVQVFGNGLAFDQKFDLLVTEEIGDTAMAVHNLKTRRTQYIIEKEHRCESSINAACIDSIRVTDKLLYYRWNAYGSHERNGKKYDRRVWIKI